MLKNIISALSFMTIKPLTKVILLSTLLTSAGLCQAATPGLPFTEDFNNTNLRDTGLTSANWSTAEQVVYSSWAVTRPPVYTTPFFGDLIRAVGSETDATYSVVLGDVDGDLDLVAGNSGVNTL